MSFILNGICPLPYLGVIRAEGEDSARFLHGQLTQDFSLLGLLEARLAAFCSAKGRMQASFVAFKRSHDDILLVCSRDLLPQTLKRLSMFVLRAKVRLSDVSASTALYGLAGPSLESLAGTSRSPWSLQALGEARLVHLYPADGVPRALWVAPAETAPSAAASLRPADWLWGEVRAGIATISRPIFEAFVPQMLNYESVGGVNFKKGCYPGQEVVARSQFRGTLKRRGYLAHSVGALQAGQEIYDAAEPDQPCGLVAQAAAAPGGGWDAIVSLQTASVASALHVGQVDGPELDVLPAPYPLLEDI
ncbi:MAG: YgfZ/GcvT domain-containing protein [Curvibacter sp.]|jgi:folate-binding protein YgfZ|nr:folate-binding protein YgfZ [Curvibacter sp.]